MPGKNRTDSRLTNRGLFVVFCGVDGSGKSTIMDLVIEQKSGSIELVTGKHPPKEWFEHPYILDKYIMLQSDKITDLEEINYTYNLRKMIEPDIIATLKQGKYMFYHRYIFSLITYYAGTNRMNMQVIRNLTGSLLKPDIVFYMKISLETFQERAKHRGLLSFQKDISFVERTMSYYDCLAEEYGWTIVDTEKLSVKEAVDLCSSVIGNHCISDASYYDLRGRKLEVN